MELQALQAGAKKSTEWRKTGAQGPHKRQNPRAVAHRGSPREQPLTDVHGKTDVGCPQRWCIVGAVTSHRHDVPCQAAHACG